MTQLLVIDCSSSRLVSSLFARRAQLLVHCLQLFVARAQLLRDEVPWLGRIAQVPLELLDLLLQPEQMGVVLAADRGGSGVVGVRREADEQIAGRCPRLGRRGRRSTRLRAVRDRGRVDELLAPWAADEGGPQVDDERGIDRGEEVVGRVPPGATDSGRRARRGGRSRLAIDDDRPGRSARSASMELARRRRPMAS